MPLKCYSTVRTQLFYIANFCSVIQICLVAIHSMKNHNTAKKNGDVDNTPIVQFDYT